MMVWIGTPVATILGIGGSDSDSLVLSLWKSFQPTVM